ncbi:MAG: glycosyl hydrolase family 8 [Cyanobacteria bacterium P01_A01_bin.135]
MIAGCTTEAPDPTPPPPPQVEPAPQPLVDRRQQALEESWQVYKRRFIQADGRVIDREASDRSISEGQAYALLRAVMSDDPETFSVVLTWSENNLRVRENGEPIHQLWAWKWGRNDADQWGTIDANFASDADLDACVALILAARRWDKPEYLDLARTKLADLWDLSTVPIPDRQLLTGNRLFIPGPKESFQPNLSEIVLNPSYLAPYAFRLFAQVDPDRDWMTLVDSSYELLNQSAGVSEVGLPGNWVTLDLATGSYRPANQAIAALNSDYGFDSYRVWWRVALDAALADEPRAEAYLEQHLAPLVDLWQTRGSVPAEIGLQGEALVDYDSPAQYGMLYPALSLSSPETAEEILNRALLPIYNGGIWGEDTAYYTQNLIWLGIYPMADLGRLDWQF